MENLRKAIPLLLSLVLLASCNKDKSKPETEFTKAMPGKHIVDMEIDRNNQFYFLTAEQDTTVHFPSWSSSIPIKVFFSRKTDELSPFEIIDDDFKQAGKMLFDRNNNLWLLDAKVLYQHTGNLTKKVLELPSNAGLLGFMALDQQDNLWVGGLQTGLYKIDPQFNITKYDTGNSQLPTNSMTNIHIDAKNTIWISLWDNKGVLKISKNDWQVFNSTNSAITSQNIWTLVSDKDGNIWIGTGYDNSTQSLMRFDGQRWETRNPETGTNVVVSGTVRGLYADSKRIYVVSEKIANGAFSSNMLLTYDGSTWNKVTDVPEDDGIRDIVVDNSRNAVWIRTANKGIFKKPI